MLSVDQALGTLAQLAVALPAFAGVITALRLGPRNHFSLPERQGYKLMLSLASLITIGCIAPFTLPGGSDDRLTWRVASPILAVALVVILCHQISIDDPPRRRINLFLWAFVTPGFCLSGVELANIVWGSHYVYIAGLGVTLVFAGIQFWLLVVLAPISAVTHAPEARPTKNDPSTARARRSRTLRHPERGVNVEPRPRFLGATRLHPRKKSIKLSRSVGAMRRPPALTVDGRRVQQHLGTVRAEEV